MTEMHPLPEDLRELAEGYLEQSLTHEDQQRLENLVLNDADARRHFVAYLHQHATLRQHRGHQPDQAQSDVLMRLGAPHEMTTPATARRAWAVAAAAVIALAAWSGFIVLSRPNAPKTPQTVATLIETKQARWGENTLPTLAGSALSPGRLNLVEGLATLQFESGAQVTLEGPADIEIVTAMRCVLHAGVIVANVPEPAHGFRIDTPTAELIDQGTAFGVSVDETGGTAVEVFQGAVDVRHGDTGETRRMTTGQNLRVGSIMFKSGESRPDEPTRVLELADTDWRIITTREGRGADTYVYSMHEPIDEPGLLPIKNGLTAWNRKIYLRFDLQDKDVRAIDDAELVLQMVPSGRGFASHVPDATFTVYGLLDESRDRWDPKTLHWRNAPGNIDDGAGVQTQHMVPVGQFTVQQGMLKQTVRLRSEGLRNWLNRDTNQLATLVIVRDTCETQSGGLVHAFAASNHPSATGPSLRIHLQNNQ